MQAQVERIKKFAYSVDQVPAPSANQWRASAAVPRARR